MAKFADEIHPQNWASQPSNTTVMKSPSYLASKSGNLLVNGVTPATLRDHAVDGEEGFKSTHHWGLNHAPDNEF